MTWSWLTRFFFGLTDFFTLADRTHSTKGHAYRFLSSHCRVDLHKCCFIAERVLKPWNVYLPNCTNPVACVFEVFYFLCWFVWICYMLVFSLYFHCMFVADSDPLFFSNKWENGINDTASYQPITSWLLRLRACPLSSFYCAMRMHKADHVVTKCLSVCPSVTRRYCVETTKLAVKRFSLSGSHTILLHWMVPWMVPVTLNNP